MNQANKKIEVLPVHLKTGIVCFRLSYNDSQRYRSIIEAETLFYRRYDQEIFPIIDAILFLRSSKQFLTVKNRQFGGKHGIISQVNERIIYDLSLYMRHNMRKNISRNN